MDTNKEIIHAASGHSGEKFSGERKLKEDQEEAEGEDKAKESKDSLLVENEDKMQARNSLTARRRDKNSASLKKPDKGVSFDKGDAFFDGAEEEMGIDKGLADQLTLNFDYLKNFVPQGYEPDLKFEPIWEAAVVSKKQELGIQLPFEEASTIFIVGSQQSGKSTLLGWFLKKEQKPTPTLFLDFEFETRESDDCKKEVCYLYELGGNAYHNIDMIKTPFVITGRLDKMSLFIVLDLSDEETMWSNIEAIVINSRKAIQTALSKMNTYVSMKLMEKMDFRLAQILALDEPLKKGDPHMDPFPIPVVIFGTKYDIFKSFEPEKRKVITRCLRAVSYYLGASLNFVSTKDKAIKKRARQVFSHHAFNSSFPVEINMDHKKPLMIGHAADSLGEIFPGNRPNQFSMEFFKHIFEAKLGKGSPKEFENPALDERFKEPAIDEIRESVLKDLALQKFVKNQVNSLQLNKESNLI